jgi:hypothetical protein
MKIIDYIFLNKETREMLACMSERPPWFLLKATSKSIRKMKRSGLWQKLDSCYVFDGPSEEWALINWVNPEQKITEE